MSMVTYSGTRFFELVALWVHRFQERAEMRAELATMDDGVIRDLGFTRSQLKAMANRPFWLA
ncbi:DUF1127 domain-containing protein [Pseudovibrio exalbescens]|nr:DUF1127 domain-containing protein [Pseudovibrio exalbescens]